MISYPLNLARQFPATPVKETLQGYFVVVPGNLGRIGPDLALFVEVVYFGDTDDGWGGGFVVCFNEDGYIRCGGSRLELRGCGGLGTLGPSIGEVAFGIAFSFHLSLNTA